MSVLTRDFVPAVAPSGSDLIAPDCRGLNFWAIDRAIRDLLPSRPGELHPESLTDPDVILSHHPARATMRRLPPSIDDQVPPAAG